MTSPVQPNVMRRRFVRFMVHGLGVVWPIISVIFLAQMALGCLIGLLEGWSMGDAIYFTYVTGLTIGYGDLVPRHALSRVLTALIGLSGVLLTGIFAAIGVRALQKAVDEKPEG